MSHKTEDSIDQGDFPRQVPYALYQTKANENCEVISNFTSKMGSNTACTVFKLKSNFLGVCDSVTIFTKEEIQALYLMSKSKYPDQK